MSPMKRGLGRGLDALLKTEEPGVRALPLSMLEPNRFQPRTSFEEAGLEELAESIRAQGVIQPIVVTPKSSGGYTIIAGERRWRAARRAGLDEVPVVVRELQDDRQLLEMALVENLQRSDLNPIEEAEAYQSLRESFGMSQEEIARQVGKGRPTVANALRLLGLPGEILDMLRDGRLTAGQARPLLGLESDRRRLEVARRAKEKGLTAREVEDLVRGAGKKRPTEPLTDPDTKAAEERLTRHLQTRVEIKRRGKGGTVRIGFHSEEELMRLFELLIASGGRT
jgi:ParB family chromosome partitioning protein